MINDEQESISNLVFTKISLDHKSFYLYIENDAIFLERRSELRSNRTELIESLN